jgi:hypothetical protein
MAWRVARSTHSHDTGPSPATKMFATPDLIRGPLVDDERSSANTVQWMPDVTLRVLRTTSGMTIYVCVQWRGMPA